MLLKPGQSQSQGKMVTVEIRGNISECALSYQARFTR